MQVKIEHVRPRNARTEIYADRVACCPLVSHVEYALRTLLRLAKKTEKTDRQMDRLTDGRQARYITRPVRRGQRSKKLAGSLRNRKERRSWLKRPRTGVSVIRNNIPVLSMD